MLARSLIYCSSDQRCDQIAPASGSTTGGGDWAYPRTMSTVDPGHRHVWTGTSLRTVRCAYMFCVARPSPADLARLRAEVASRRAISLDYRAKS
jgi:hypothetical protein